jgi:phospholipid/cholesterol/gamma-HCH transport system permease protein
MIVRLINGVGKKTIQACDNMGSVAMFWIETFRAMISTKPKIKKIFYQMSYIGVSSAVVVLLTGAAVGSVLAWHSYTSLHRFGVDQFTGTIVFISMVKEFGPVLSAVMVTGRAGSAMTAEIGTMRITEQIDALKTLSINVPQYLIVPRVIATTLIMPFLSIFCSFCGIVAGYIISVMALDLNSEVYLEAMRTHGTLDDIIHGLIKALIFGFLLSLIACYKGYITKGGAKGVGQATTQSVVFANVTIFLSDYILTSLIK